MADLGNTVIMYTRVPSQNFLRKF